MIDSWTPRLHFYKMGGSGHADHFFYNKGNNQSSVTRRKILSQSYSVNSK